MNQYLVPWGPMPFSYEAGLFRALALYFTASKFRD